MSESQFRLLQKQLEIIKKSKANEWFIDTQIHNLHQASTYIFRGIEFLKEVDLATIPLTQEIQQVTQIAKTIEMHWKRLSKYEKPE